MIGLAGLAVLVMVGAAIGLVIAWIGAALNTANLADKTWFIVLLAGGVLSVGLLVTLAYVIGPDGQPTVFRAPEGQIPPSRQSLRQRPPRVLLKSRTLPTADSESQPGQGRFQAS
jgi:hypothetical protein